MISTSNLVASIKSLDRVFWPQHRVALSPTLDDLLLKYKIVVADVGSADGPEEVWLPLQKLIHFVTFEPCPRPDQPPTEYESTNFPIGLWSSKTSQNLYITAHPDSSSLIEVNAPLFQDFMVKDGMAPAGTASINLDTLDNLLLAKPSLSPDFLKIDVEGADLEVLKGSAQALQRTILGIRVETAFRELHLGAPLFSDIDAFLTSQGFVLFHLGRNHWVRANHLHGYSSAPQVIWGDAVYFLTRDNFLKRLRALDAAQRHIALVKFVVILLRHGVHDYAAELIDAAQSASLVDATSAGTLKQAVLNSMDRSVFYFFKLGLGVLFSLLILLVSCPLPEPRKRAIYYVKQRAGRLFYDLWRLTSMEGRIPGSVVGDPFV